MSLNFVTPSKTKCSHLNSITKTAMKILGESKEQLDEISQNKIKSAVYKADAASIDAKIRHSSTKDPSDLAYSSKKRSQGDRLHNKLVNKVDEAMEKDKNGVMRDRLGFKSAGAVRKPKEKDKDKKEIKKEEEEMPSFKDRLLKALEAQNEEELDEVSSKLAKSYLEKSGNKISQVSSKDKRPFIKALQDKTHNRSVGRKRAEERLNKEETKEPEIKNITLRQQLKYISEARQKMLGEKNWIQGAIKHPGAEKRAAAKAGMTTHAYMEKHKHDKGKAGKRANLGLTLSKMHH